MPSTSPSSGWTWPRRSGSRANFSEFKVVVALLPEPTQAQPQDAQAHLDWLRTALEALRKEPRKAILKLNF